MESTATLIKWGEHVDPERIKRWLEKLVEEGHAEYTNTQKYDSDYSTPVLYFP